MIKNQKVLSPTKEHIYIIGEEARTKTDKNVPNQHEWKTSQTQLEFADFFIIIKMTICCCHKLPLQMMKVVFVPVART